MSKRIISFSPPDVGEHEINNIIEVLKSGWITTGPQTKLFERLIANYCNTEKAVCLNSATACLELILRLFGIGVGDEVITTAYTYTASASVIAHVGAKIILVDTLPGSYEIDYDSVSRVITSKTKAIIAVDIAGRLCDYERLNNIIANAKHLFHTSHKFQEIIGSKIVLIADAAHSFGGVRDNLISGQLADFTSFSFHAVKNLTTGEGGALTWKALPISSEIIYKQFMLMSLHGQSKDALSKSQLGAWEYDIQDTYYKCNMTDIMAAIGISQIERFPELLKRRKNIIESYNAGFRSTPIHPLEHFIKGNSSGAHLYLTRVEGVNEYMRNEIIVKLSDRGIACNVHYKPLPMHTAYKNLGFDIKDFPNAYSQYAQEITLPLHTLLTDADIEYIITEYRRITSV
ncbi:MAG: DegT/DnrJ/EryC1/StrS family aminotransferase [Christensenellaceae bacterium]|jgi:dTDP-4-amino-4,6-dideoxygalactose transaminase|nr:DegT/DnrJ/EryC1/StrS family aminotransferase [Christensenellaceae bacterium]